MAKLNLNQVGAASMITVIFFSIVLTILSLGFIRLAINEQRASTDDDLSTRAYYAAESGLEDARRALREWQEGTLSDDPVSGNLNQDECAPPSTSDYDPVLSPPSDYDIEYTCQLLDLSPGALEFYFDGANQSVEFPIFSIDNTGNTALFNRLEVRWHVNATEENDGDGVVASYPGGSVVGRSNFAYTSGSVPDLYDVATWNSNNHPAMMRVSIFSHPDGSYTRDQIRNYSVFMDPVADGTGNAGRPLPFLPGNVNFKDGELVDADCDDAVNIGGYFCSAQFTNLPPSGRQWYLRLTALYRPTHAQIRIWNGNGASAEPRFFDAVQAVADVTGRAGEVYRRVESRISLVTPSIFPDAALTSLNDICKDFFITDVLSDFDGLIDPATGRGTSCTIP